MSALRPRTFRLQIVILIALALALGTGVVAGLASKSSKWVAAADVKDVEKSGVVLNEDRGVFVVRRAGKLPLVLSRFGPWNGEHVDYCESSGGFEGFRSGAKYDSRGNYLGGPSPRGLDRYPVRVRDGVVEYQPNRIVPGPTRWKSGRRARDPSGPFCLFGG